MWSRKTHGSYRFLPFALQTSTRFPAFSPFSVSSTNWSNKSCIRILPCRKRWIKKTFMFHLDPMAEKQIIHEINIWSWNFLKPTSTQSCSFSGTSTPMKYRKCWDFFGHRQGTIIASSEVKNFKFNYQKNKTICKRMTSLRKEWQNGLRKNPYLSLIIFIVHDPTRFTNCLNK